MSDEDALLAAIAAQPEEDTPRLVYADWLDENDRPIRAEFIRLQCTVKQVDRPADEQQKLLNRQRFLLENYRRDILGPLGADLMISNIVIERGFLTELKITALLFLHRARAIGQLRPVPRIYLTSGGGTTFERMLRCPELEVVESLVLPFAVGEAGARQLAACPHLARLKSLDFGLMNTIGNAGLDVLAFSSCLPALVELSVRGNDLSDVAIGRLVRSPLWLRLRRLDLADNDLTEASADHFINAPVNTIECLNLQNTNISRAASRRLRRKFGSRVELP